MTRRQADLDISSADAPAASGEVGERAAAVNFAAERTSVRSKPAPDGPSVEASRTLRDLRRVRYRRTKSRAGIEVGVET